MAPEIRTRDEKGKIQIEKAAPTQTSRMDAKEKAPPRRGRQPAHSMEQYLRLKQTAPTRRCANAF